MNLKHVPNVCRLPLCLIALLSVTNCAIIPDEKSADGSENVASTGLRSGFEVVEIVHISDDDYTLKNGSSDEKYEINQGKVEITEKITTADLPRGLSCHQELGLSSVQSNTIIKTSSGNPVDARLYSPNLWIINETDIEPWIQVEFDSEEVIMGFVVRHDMRQGVRLAEFYVVWGDDCNSLFNSSRLNHHRVFDVPYDPGSNRSSDVTIIVDEPFIAKCLLIYPTVDNEEEDPLALQIELMGCGALECTEDLPTKFIPWENGIEVNFGSEKLITNITFNLQYNVLVENFTENIDVLTSRTCRTFGSTSGIKLVISAVPNSHIVVVFHSPVRLQCVRLNISRDWKLDQTQGKSVATGCDPRDLCGQSLMDHTHVKRRQKRIIGGQPLSRSNFPWLVSLKYHGFHSFMNLTPHHFSHLCGASLIHPSWILTAAHCFSEHPVGLNQVENWSAALGEHTLLSDEDTTEIYLIEKLFTPTSFEMDLPITNDIALLKLKEPVPMSSYARTICLAESDAITEGTPCTVSGWGAIRGDYRTGANNVPLEAQLPIIDKELCRFSYYNLSDGHPAKEWTVIDESVVCAAYMEGGRDTCPGDSGGPLSCFDGEKWIQAGITSGGFKCGEPEYPGVYTSVFNFLDWIQLNIANN